MAEIDATSRDRKHPRARRAYHGVITSSNCHMPGHNPRLSAIGLQCMARAALMASKPYTEPTGRQGDHPATINFASFRLDFRSGRLLSNDKPVPLRPKTWAVLVYLAQRPGVLIGKDALLDAVWADTAVTPDTLNKSIGELRT